MLSPRLSARACPKLRLRANEEPCCLGRRGVRATPDPSAPTPTRHRDRHADSISPEVFVSNLPPALGRWICVASSSRLVDDNRDAQSASAQPRAGAVFVA